MYSSSSLGSELTAVQLKTLERMIKKDMYRGSSLGSELTAV